MQSTKGSYVAWAVFAAALLVAALGTVVAAPEAEGAKAPRCFGERATITGTDGDDPDVIGTNGRDVIVTFGGMDNVQADPEQVDGAADRVCTGSGDDGADGNAGADSIKGGGGDDTLTGGLNNDRINGGPGNDIIDSDAREGADNFKGGAGDDQINGAGDDSVDVIKCGGGTDTVTADPEDKVDMKSCENVTPPGP